MAPVIDVVLSGSQRIGKAYVEGGSVSPVFSGRYLRAGTWHHFVYQAHERVTCLQQYVESIGETMESVIISSPTWNRGEVDLDMRPNINPRFSRRRNAEVVVEYMRGGVRNWFEFGTPLGSPELRSYIESLGLNVDDVKVTALTIPEFV